LLVCKNLYLLTENPDLLLAASKSEASEELLTTIGKEMKK